MDAMNPTPPPDPKRAGVFGSRLAQDIAYRLSDAFFRDFVRLCVSGAENVPARGAALLAANHPSPFDPFLLTVAARRWVDWAAMVELSRRPWLAACWRALATIPVDRSRPDRRAAAECLRRLRAGRLVGIFPERGIRPDEASLLSGGPADGGVCRLALAARAPIVPAVILGSAAMHRFSWGWMLPRQAFKVSVRFGAPLLPEESADKAGAARLKARLIAAMIDLAR
jgi:1-acyl-sn-glycerol-3-phosphate acyltransferase